MSLFNLYMLNCTVAAFDYYCLAEHFLANPNGGAVSVIGANNSAFPNASGNYMNEYLRSLFDRRRGPHRRDVRALATTADAASPRLGDNVDLWTHYVYTILADPEMPLFTGSVGTVNVVHVPSVGLGTSNILVNVTSGGQPVDSAVVCLTKDGDDYQYGATNALGNVTLPFTAETAGSIKVVVTGLNVARHEGSITVNAAAGAYVNYASLDGGRQHERGFVRERGRSGGRGGDDRLYDIATEHGRGGDGDGVVGASDAAHWG